MDALTFECPHCGSEGYQERISEDDGISGDYRWIAWEFECSDCHSTWIAEWHLDAPIVYRW